MLGRKFSKILIPLDGSKNSLRGLRFGIDLAKYTDSLLVGINIYKIPYFVKSTAFLSEKKSQSKKILDDGKKISENSNISFIGKSQQSDNIGKAILTFAQKNSIDLIVIGSRGPDPEGGLFLGSVANYVIHKSKIPVTLIK